MTRALESIFMLKGLVFVFLFICGFGDNVHAAGIDRSGQNTSVIFERGRHLELGVTHIAPSVSGRDTLGANSGNVLESYYRFSAAFKDDVTKKIAYSIIFDQPFGVATDYSAPGYLFSNSGAGITTNSLTALVKYKVNNTWNIFAGPRIQSFDSDASVVISDRLDYQLDQPGTDYGLGYSLGASVAYKPLGLFAFIAYNSKIKYDFLLEESANNSPYQMTGINVNTPKSLNMNFRFKAASRTFLSAQARWVNWSKFDITPVLFQDLTNSSLVFYEKDITNYSFSISHLFKNKVAGLIRIGFEPATKLPILNLGPIDGNEFIELGGAYPLSTQTTLKFGVRYVSIGDATTTVDSVFDRNKALAIGLSLVKKY